MRYNVRLDGVCRGILAFDWHLQASGFMRSLVNHEAWWQ
jgi:hypothetical protein